ncbi:MAG TPA: class I SAM-dependent methyltransferase [Candidatus Binatia bacterium]|nr:class I SAM-dependent methyltransferase [Candidatus Binatia bacterium]
MTDLNFEQIWRARYDQWALKYDADHLISGWSAQGLARRFQLLLQLLERINLKPGSRILDLGAGPGMYTREITARRFQCIGIDYSHNVLLAARRKGKREPYIQADAYQLPFRDRSFDAVVCIGVLQSLDRTGAALDEIARVLASGGWIFLDGLNRFFWLSCLRRARSLGHAAEKRLNEYNPYRVREMCECLGFVRPEIHWLAVPRQVQTVTTAARDHERAVLGTLLGHSFLLIAAKSGS